jgi:hypothetical protein
MEVGEEHQNGDVEEEGSFALSFGYFKPFKMNWICFDSPPGSEQRLDIRG